MSAPALRVAQVVHSYPQDSPFLLEAFHGLVEAGLDVYMICGSDVGFPRGRANRVRYHERIRIMPSARPRLLAATWLVAGLFRCLLANPRGTIRYFRRGFQRFRGRVLREFFLDQELIRLNPAVVHFQFGTLAVGRTHVRDLLGCRVIASFRGYDLNFVQLEDPTYYANVWRDADIVHTLGEDLWSRAVRRGCPLDKPRALIPPAIDLAFFDPAGRRHSALAGTPERPLRIVSVGRLVWKKGYEFALDALRAAGDRGLSFEYHIIGDGEFYEAIAFAIAQLGLRGVTLCGRLAPQQIREELLWADVFLHTAVSEGFCNAVIEAQAMRLPVVCSDADGLRENVLDSVSGLVVRRRDSHATAEGLLLLAGDPELRDRMGNAGRVRATSQFALEQQLVALAGLYTYARMSNGLVHRNSRTPH